MAFNNNNIDPHLRKKSSGMSLLEELRQENEDDSIEEEHSSDNGTPRVTSPTPPHDSSSGDFSATASSPTGASSMSGVYGASETPLATFGTLLKRNRQLFGRSEADLDRYCQTWDPEQCMAMEYFTLLEVKDMLQQMVKGSKWTMDEDLKKTCTRYAKAFILSPTLKQYKGGSSAEQLLKAMRELNVADLPEQKNSTQVDRVLTFITEQLTQARFALKAKIVESLAEGSPIRNVADLCQALVSGTTSLQPTAQMYLRVSFLRSIFVKMYSKKPKLPPTTEDKEKKPEKINTSNFFDVVDKTLNKWAEHSKSEVELHTTFTRNFVNDKKLYGDPIASAHNVVTASKVEGWITTVNKYAGSELVCGSKKRKLGK